MPDSIGTRYKGEHDDCPIDVPHDHPGTTDSDQCRKMLDKPLKVRKDGRYIVFEDMWGNIVVLDFSEAFDIAGDIVGLIPAHEIARLAATKKA